MGSKPKGGGPKPGTKQAKAAADKSAQRTQSPSPNESDPPKKPTVKELIGGASWTGKLPVNLLSEHCQKQKWEKPEYTMVF
jgi:ATP-dependent RNA helicase DHX57